VFQSSAGDRPSAPNVAVLVANGESTLDADRVSAAAAACRGAGVVLVVVAADRTLADSAELRSIVSPPTEHNYFIVPYLSALPNYTQSVFPSIMLCPGLYQLASVSRLHTRCIPSRCTALIAEMKQCLVTMTNTGYAAQTVYDDLIKCYCAQSY